MFVNYDYTTLTRQLTAQCNKEARIASIWAEIRADDADTVAESLVGYPADQGSALNQTERAENWPEEELLRCRQLAEEGDIRSSRRVAELLELLGRDDEALAWWRQAAQSGDRDAILYLDAAVNP